MPLILQDVVRVDRALGEPVAGAHVARPPARAGACPAGSGTRAPSPSSPRTTTLRMPRVTPPNSHARRRSRTTIAASFGRRASNSSATRGRPPVMSRVLADLAADLDQHVARPRTCCAVAHLRGARRSAAGSAPILLAAWRRGCRCAGCSSLSRSSMMTSSLRPVVSSTSSRTVTFSLMSTNRTVPAVSVDDRLVVGVPLEQRLVAARPAAPSSTNRCAP